MHKFFLSKIKYEKTSQEGKIVKVTEQYLVDALSFTECEARITKEMQPFISGEFEVAAIAKKNYSEIVSEMWGINAIEAEANKMLKANIPSSAEADKWFECKLNFITLDEEKGVEKKTPVFMLVRANTVNSAHDTLIEHMRKSMADYTIEGVKETKIIDVFKYQAD
jgi:hypothetical protein